MLYGTLNQSLLEKHIALLQESEEMGGHGEERDHPARKRRREIREIPNEVNEEVCGTVILICYSLFCHLSARNFKPFLIKKNTLNIYCIFASRRIVP
jgi:hypothetical protein